MLRKLLPFTLLLALACGRLKEPTDPLGGSGDPIDPTATFTRVQNEIFTPTARSSAVMIRSDGRKA